VFSDDPLLGLPVTETWQLEVEMGAISAYAGDSLTFQFELSSDAPIEDVEVRNGMTVVETVRPYQEVELGNRIRIIWEGSEYRGRGRQTVWDGCATVTGNAFKSPKSINFWNLDLPLKQTSDTRLEWRSLTTGGFAGIDVSLDSVTSGVLSIDTGLVKADIKIADIGLEPIVFKAGGIERKMKVFRLPDENKHRRIARSVCVPLHEGKDNAVYLRATTEDGCFIYSSPIYVIRR
jgi:hypothetical protein